MENKCGSCKWLGQRVVEEWMEREESYHFCPFAYDEIGLIEINDDPCGEYVCKDKQNRTS